MPLLECSATLTSQCSLKFQNLVPETMLLPLPVVDSTPPDADQPLISPVPSTTQPLRSLPSINLTGLPSRQAPSSLSGSTGACTPTHFMGGSFRPSVSNVPSSLPSTSLALKIMRPFGRAQPNCSSPGLTEISWMTFMSPPNAVTNLPRGASVPAPAISTHHAALRGSR